MTDDEAYFEVEHRNRCSSYLTATGGPEGDYNAFLRAVEESPDDDSVRLIFADWLEERGDPRAEFIRIQMELSRIFERQTKEELTPQQVSIVSRLQAEARKLLRSEGSQWLPSHWFGVSRYIFRGGFIDGAVVDATSLLAQEKEVQEFIPRIRRLKIINIQPGQLERILISPIVSQLDSLDLSENQLGVHGALSVANSPLLSRLKDLNLGM